MTLRSIDPAHIFIGSKRVLQRHVDIIIMRVRSIEVGGMKTLIFEEFVFELFVLKVNLLKIVDFIVEL